MIRCVCGSKFKTAVTGAAVITMSGLFACDVLECPKCAKRILDVTEAALETETAKIMAEADRMTAKGKAVYGHRFGGV